MKTTKRVFKAFWIWVVSGLWGYRIDYMDFEGCYFRDVSISKAWDLAGER